MAGKEFERREILRMLAMAAAGVTSPGLFLLPSSCKAADYRRGDAKFGIPIWPSDGGRRTSSDVNVTQLENAKKGDPTWLIPASRRAWHRIEGYVWPPSVNRGGSINFFVTTDEPDYVMKIYRLGWYGGDGARLMATIPISGIVQTNPSLDASVNLADCNWRKPYVLNIPYDPEDPTYWASGMYLAQMTQNKSGKQNYIPFVVRDDARASDVKFVQSILTYHAYNSWGHYSLYLGGATQVFGERARKVSLNRPYYRGFGAGDLLNLGYEMSALRFLERDGYDTTYTTEVDLHQNSDELFWGRIAFFGGHTEYWSTAMRNHLQAAVDTGVNVIFTDANSIYWHVRFENDSNNTPNRILVCYKDSTEDPYSADPQTAPETTVRFCDPPVNWPQDPLVGLSTDYNSRLGVDGDVIIADASNWVFNGTGLRNGDRLENFLGPEVDTRGLSPAGLQILTETPFQSPGGSGVAQMSIYQAGSGAWVFDSGTSRFNYGLDDFYELGLNFTPTYPDLYTNPRGNPLVQQMMRNLLSRMLAGSQNHLHGFSHSDQDHPGVAAGER
jgi:hypothetical protein